MLRPPASLSEALRTGPPDTLDTSHAGWHSDAGRLFPCNKIRTLLRPDITSRLRKNLVSDGFAAEIDITLSSVYQFLNEESIPLEVRKRSLCAKSYFFAVSTIKVAKL
jgi:hypothetical protein